MSSDPLMKARLQDAMSRDSGQSWGGHWVHEAYSKGGAPSVRHLGLRAGCQSTPRTAHAC